jgi:hypothetical protein
MLPARKAKYGEGRGSGGFFVPRLEGLEDRVVPASAIRVVPNFLLNQLPTGTNQSTNAIGLGFNIDFYGIQTGSVFVNEAGNITLSSPLKQFIPPFTPLLPVSLGQGLIAPFWAGVDTTGAGTVFYGRGTIGGRAAFAVTWSGVGFDNAHATPTDSFQLVLIDRSDTGAGNFDIEFNYNNIMWDSSDTMAGTGGLAAMSPGTTGRSASVGFSQGTGAPGTFFVLPGSNASHADPFVDGGADALHSHDLNANTLGRYHFFFRNGTLATNTNFNVTTTSSVYAPLSYIYNPFTQTYSGNATVVNNSFQLGNEIATDFALDEPTPGVQGSQTTQVTIVFTSLPNGVVLANATGYTSAGQPYITVSENVAFGPKNTLRIPLVFRNPLRQPLGTFFQHSPIQVFIGAFDPTQQLSGSLP